MRDEIYSGPNFAKIEEGNNTTIEFEELYNAENQFCPEARKPKTSAQETEPAPPSEQS